MQIGTHLVIRDRQTLKGESFFSRLQAETDAGLDFLLRFRVRLE